MGEANSVRRYFSRHSDRFALPPRGGPVSDNAEVMSNKQHTHIQLALSSRNSCKICAWTETSSAVVGHRQLIIPVALTAPSQSSPAAFAAGELMRIICQPFCRLADPTRSRQLRISPRAASRRIPRGVKVLHKAVFPGYVMDLTTHRLLKNHGDLITAYTAQRLILA